ncbi:MAG: hypothetical protein ACP5IM_04185 [Candidatus Bathyarchaeia archaeon]
MKGAKEDFDKLLMESIDEALTSLGDSVKQSIYFHLEDKFGISKEEIPGRIDDFADGIEKIFGLGAHFIEILIMKKLHEKIGKPLEWDEQKELVFVDYVKAARQSFEANKA